MLNLAVTIMLAVIIGWTVHRIQSRYERRTPKAANQQGSPKPRIINADFRSVIFIGAFRDPRSEVQAPGIAANTSRPPRLEGGAIQVARSVVLQHVGPADRHTADEDDRERLDWSAVDRKSSEK